ncbi:MAG: hypothetical protein AAGK25_09005, partial [Pseudomonadota bacterium]
LPFVVVGFGLGFWTGVSSQPNASAVIPAVISFVGAVFAFAVATNKNQAGAIGFAVCACSITIIYSITVGAELRENGRVERLKKLSEQEKRIRLWRKNNNLPAEIPEWMLSGERK